jgi:hypothetical protein
VCDRVSEKVTRKVAYTEWVPYTETIQVPVHPCADYGSDCGGRGRLFGRRRGGCN